tara:strand:+ start:7480 stop:7758 length:279 start_codon:yes stop_codon:yes gene_type:complete
MARDKLRLKLENTNLRLKENDTRSINNILDHLFSELNKIKSVLSEQSNKGLTTPDGAIRMKQSGKGDDYTIEFKSQNGWISNNANIYKLKGN